MNQKFDIVTLADLNELADDPAIKIKKWQVVTGSDGKPEFAVEYETQVEYAWGTTQ